MLKKSRRQQTEPLAVREYHFPTWNSWTHTSMLIPHSLHICIHVYIRTCTCIYAFIHVYKDIYICPYIHVYYVYACVIVYILYMYIYTMYMYIYTCIHMYVMHIQMCSYNVHVCITCNYVPYGKVVYICRAWDAT